MRGKPKRGVAEPGSKRAARLQQIEAGREPWLARLVERLIEKRSGLPARKNPVGVKRVFVPWQRERVFTPYFAKERARRRAARRVAHESRRVNR